MMTPTERRKAKRLLERQAQTMSAHELIELGMKYMRDGELNMAGLCARLFQRTNEGREKIEAYKPKPGGSGVLIR